MSAARLNRALLGALGALLLAAGTLGLAAGLGLLDGVDPAAPLVPPTTTFLPWAPYATVAGALAVGLLCLRWLLAQALPRPRAGTWSVPGPLGATRLAAGRVATAVAADVAAHPGVATASAGLTGPLQQPRLHLDVATTSGTPVADVRDRIATHALPRLCRVLGVDAVRAELVLRIDAGAPPRVR